MRAFCWTVIFLISVLHASISCAENETPTAVVTEGQAGAQQQIADEQYVTGAITGSNKFKTVAVADENGDYAVEIVDNIPAPADDSFLYHEINNVGDRPAPEE